MRILSWNACGDVGIKAKCKLGELKSAIQYFDQDPIGIICLQEINGSKGSLCNWLRENGWQVCAFAEQENGRGKDMAIAVHDDYFEIIYAETVDLSSYRDKKGITNKPIRVPMIAQVRDKSSDEEFLVFTWHATLGSRQNEDFSGFSSDLKVNYADYRVLIGADFNQYEEDFQGTLYDDFAGISNNLDYILGKGFVISDGLNADESNSDHLPISANFA